MLEVIQSLLFSIDAAYFAPSALQKLIDPNLGRMAQAITFRAFGAETRSFHTVSHESRFATANENRTRAVNLIRLTFYFHKSLFRLTRFCN